MVQKRFCTNRRIQISWKWAFMINAAVEKRVPARNPQPASQAAAGSAGFSCRKSCSGNTEGVSRGGRWRETALSPGLPKRDDPEVQIKKTVQIKMKQTYFVPLMPSDTGSPDHLYMEIPHDTGKSGRKLSDAKRLIPKGRTFLNKKKHCTCTYLSFGDSTQKHTHTHSRQHAAAAAVRLLLSQWDGWGSAARCAGSALLCSAWPLGSSCTLSFTFYPHFFLFLFF